MNRKQIEIIETSLAVFLYIINSIKLMSNDVIEYI